MNVPTRYRLPVAIVASVGVVAVVLVVLLAGGSDRPNDTSPPRASPSASIDPYAAPENSVRAFFEAFAQARRTDDPSLVKPFVTSEDSSAYLSVSGFLLGQKEVKKASVTTVLRLENLRVESSATTAPVTLDYTEGGYDISLDTGEPLESAAILPTTQVTVELVLSDGRWLVDSYEEIAEITSTNLGTVKSRLNRARASFAELIEPKLR